MAIINPYLNFKGNTEEAFNHYRTVFGGEFSMVQRFGDTPEKDNMPAEDRNKIMHIALPIGKGNILMGTDAVGAQAANFVAGNNMLLSLHIDSQEEADRVYAALSEGGKQSMPMQETFWGAYFGMLSDKFGINWMISYDKHMLNQQ